MATRSNPFEFPALLRDSMIHIRPHVGVEVKRDSKKTLELQKIVDAARAANKLGMHVSAGHGLDYHNLESLQP